MDEVVSVRRSFLNRIRAFCNQFAEQCRTCLRRGTESCSECHTAQRAKQLVEEIDRARNAEEERFFVENPRIELAMRVVRAIREAARPVMACEIRMEGVAKQRKNSILKSMRRLGYISASKTANGTYIYSAGPAIFAFDKQAKHNRKAN